MIAWILGHVLLGFGFAVLCWGTGDLLLRNVVFESRALRAAAATAAGYGVLGQCIFALAAAGLLTRTAVILVYGVAASAALAAVVTRRAAAGEEVIIGRAGLLLIAAGALPSFLIALYPIVGYDATMYHMVFARLFAEARGLVFAGALRFPLFPQLGEMHYAAAIVLLGDHAAQLTQWLALPVTAVAAAALARQNGGGRAAGLLAAALWLGTPSAIYFAASGYIDVSLTMFVTLAVVCAVPALSGAFTGLAAATKYHGLFFVAALARRRSLVPFLAAAALVAVPWYAHIARETGNPVFPFLTPVFGDNEYRTRVDRSVQAALADPVAALGEIASTSPLGVIESAIVEPMRRGIAPLSPVLLLLLPFAIAGAGVAPRLRKPLLVAAIYALLVSRMDWRFLLVIVPVCAAAIGIALERVLPQRAMVAAVLVCLAPGLIWAALLLIARYGPIPVTPAQREAFVAGRIPVYRAVRSLGPHTVYVLGAPNMAYYCRGTCLGDVNGPYRFALVEPLLGDPPRLAAQLRRFGAAYFVVDRAAARFRPAPPFRLVYADAHAEAYVVESEGRSSPAPR